MMKKFLLLITLLMMLPANAGVYEDALAKNNNVFLYLYTPECSTCKAFEEIYSDIQKSNKDFGYVKVNAETSYGMRLMIKYRGRFVPYIVLTNSKTKKSVNVNHSCVMNEVCLLRAMKNFKG